MWILEKSDRSPEKKSPEKSTLKKSSAEEPT